MNKQQPNRWSINLILAMLIAILVIVVTLQNTSIVSLRFLVWEMQASLVLLLALSFLAGALLIYLLMLWQLQRLKKEKRKLEKEIKKRGMSDESNTPLS